MWPIPGSPTYKTAFTNSTNFADKNFHDPLPHHRLTTMRAFPAIWGCAHFNVAETMFPSVELLIISWPKRTCSSVSLFKQNPFKQTDTLLYQNFQSVRAYCIVGLHAEASLIVIGLSKIGFRMSNVIKTMNNWLRLMLSWLASTCTYACVTNSLWKLYVNRHKLP